MNILRRSELNNLEFSPEFFQEEVREGFYVSTMMKRYWASQLKVLSIIARICDKYGLKWFADCGTLLGAVRHGGYVPWDDDLDICMLRDDWIRFFEIAEKELPKDFRALTIESEFEYNEIIGRVVNSDSINYGTGHMNEFFGCPYTVGLDIFPLDGLYEDQGKELERKARARKTIEELNCYNPFGGQLDIHKKQMYKSVEKIYMECKTGSASKVALMPFYISEDDHIYPKELFENIVKLPFEETYVNVPARYEEVLDIEYGDYLQVSKSGGIHDYPVYAEQERMLGEKLGGNPFRYTFNMQELLGSMSRYVKRVLKQGQETGQSRKIRTIAFLPCRAKWWNSMEPLWRMYSQDETVEVHVLPIFYFDCDHNGNIGKKHDERDLFPNYLNVEACEKFDFEGIHPDMIVTQVPYDGHSTAMTVHEFFYSANLLRFTDELIYVPCFDMDPPVDEEDKAAAAISAFVEQEAVVNADRVVVSRKDLRQFYIKKLVELSSEDTRQYWEQKIVVFGDEKVSGAEVRMLQPEADEKKYSDSKKCKSIMYYVNISSLLKYGNDALEKIRESFDIFEGAGDRIHVIFVLQEQLLENLKAFDSQLYAEFEMLIENIRNRSNISCKPEQKALLQIQNIDAYYGDASLFVRKCVRRKIPVMIQDYNTRKI